MAQVRGVIEHCHRTDHVWRHGMAGQKGVLVVDDDSAFAEGRGVCREAFSLLRLPYAAWENLRGQLIRNVNSIKPFPGSNDLKTTTS